MTHTCFLVIRCDGTTRTVNRTPRLRIDEVAYRLRIVVPSAWGRLNRTDIEITLPDPPEAELLADEPAVPQTMTPEENPS